MNKIPKEIREKAMLLLKSGEATSFTHALSILGKRGGHKAGHTKRQAKATAERVERMNKPLTQQLTLDIGGHRYV